MAQTTLGTVGFIGGGMMASALVSGLLHKGVLGQQALIVSDPVKECRDRFERQGIRTTDDNREVISNSDVVVLAVKPDMVVPVLQHIHGACMTNSPLIISIAAGISLAILEEVCIVYVP
jgi:pyrroline-5-carboxylate reductase